jgi:hypothetical protein
MQDRESGPGAIHIGRFVPRLVSSNSARHGLYFGLESRGREGECEVLDEDYIRSIREQAEGA